MKTLTLKTAALATMFAVSVSAIQPRPAHAAIGGALALFGAGAGIPMMVVGGIIGGTGVLLVGGAALGGTAGQTDTDTVVAEIGAEFLGVLTIGTGLLVLEDGSQKAVFKPVSAADATKARLTPAELAAYTAELDEINAVSDEIADQLAREPKPTFERSHELWEQYRPGISEPAYSALEKISADFAVKAQHHKG